MIGTFVDFRTDGGLYSGYYNWIISISKSTSCSRSSDGQKDHYSFRSEKDIRQRRDFSKVKITPTTPIKGTDEEGSEVGVPGFVGVHTSVPGHPGPVHEGQNKTVETAPQGRNGDTLTNETHGPLKGFEESFGQSSKTYSLTGPHLVVKKERPLHPHCHPLPGHPVWVSWTVSWSKVCVCVCV